MKLGRSFQNYDLKILNSERFDDYSETDLTTSAVSFEKKFQSWKVFSQKSRRVSASL